MLRAWVGGDHRSSVPRDMNTAAECPLSLGRAAPQHLSDPVKEQCCAVPPSPRGWDTPVPSPALPPLLPQEGCLSTLLIAGGEHRDAKQQCDLGSGCLDMERNGRRHYIPALPTSGIPSSCD